MVTGPRHEVTVTGLTNAQTLTLAAARHAVESALATATTGGFPICAAVVDRGAHLVSFDRMEQAPLLSVQLAQDKAYTVAAFGLATHQWWEMIKAEPPLVHGLVKTDRLIVFGGGVPITFAGQLVGAIGVSGGSADQDRSVAEAAATSCEELLRNLDRSRDKTQE